MYDENEEEQSDKESKGIAPILLRLPPIYQNQAKSEIFDVVQKFEMKGYRDKREGTSMGIKEGEA